VVGLRVDGRDPVAPRVDHEEVQAGDVHRRPGGGEHAQGRLQRTDVPARDAEREGHPVGRLDLVEHGVLQVGERGPHHPGPLHQDEEGRLDAVDQDRVVVDGAERLERARSRRQRLAPQPQRPSDEVPHEDDPATASTV